MSNEESIDNEQRVFRVPEYRIDWLVSKVEKLNKKAAKLETSPIVLAVVSVVEETDASTGVVTKFHNVRISGEPPKIAGWEFIATLTHTPEGVIINKLPTITEDVPVKYRSIGSICEHCQKDWIARKYLYLVRNPQGEYKQVGSMCLHDFTGHADPYNLAAYATELAQLEADILNDPDELKLGSREPAYIDLEYFLAYTAAVIDEKGWVSRKEAMTRQDKVATADTVLTQMLDFKLLKPTQRIKPTDTHFEYAREAIVFAREKIPDDNDYRRNMKVLTAGKSFPIKQGAGVVASLIPYVQRDKEQFAIREAARERAQESKHVGKVGERLYNIEVKVLSTRQLPGYGDSITILHKLLDHEGNLYTWFATTQDLDADEEYTISGTVKEHKMYQGIKETVLTRCRVE